MCFSSLQLAQGKHNLNAARLLLLFHPVSLVCESVYNAQHLLTVIYFGSKNSELGTSGRFTSGGTKISDLHTEFMSS